MLSEYPIVRTSNETQLRNTTLRVTVHLDHCHPFPVSRYLGNPRGAPAPFVTAHSPMFTNTTFIPKAHWILLGGADGRGGMQATTQASIPEQRR